MHPSPRHRLVASATSLFVVLASCLVLLGGPGSVGSAAAGVLVESGTQGDAGQGTARVGHKQSPAKQAGKKAAKKAAKKPAKKAAKKAAKKKRAAKRAAKRKAAAERRAE